MAGVPRIEADTVAEHRAQQHDAILDAAEQILLTHGYEGLSFRTLGERTGLARNSIYRYFSSRDEVIGELCDRALPHWLAAVDDAMARAGTLEDKVAAYVQVHLRMVATGHHKLAEVLAHAPLGPEARARIEAMPDQAAERLAAVLDAGGHPRPLLTAQLVTGMLNAGIRMLSRGDDEAQIVVNTMEAARRVVREPARP
jgi:AcrR family transcriptional regulator